MCLLEEEWAITHIQSSDCVVHRNYILKHFPISDLYCDHPDQAAIVSRLFCCDDQQQSFCFSLILANHSLPRSRSNISKNKNKNQIIHFLSFIHVCILSYLKLSYLMVRLYSASLQLILSCKFMRWENFVIFIFLFQASNLCLAQSCP